MKIDNHYLSPLNKCVEIRVSNAIMAQSLVKRHKFEFEDEPWDEEEI